LGNIDTLTVGPVQAAWKPASFTSPQSFVGSRVFATIRNLSSSKPLELTLPSWFGINVAALQLKLWQAACHGHLAVAIRKFSHLP
jgi:predicted oxidoreductase